jgi:outer membrane protein OmpA-like peptidoglycan-associated protein
MKIPYYTLLPVLSAGLLFFSNPLFSQDYHVHEYKKLPIRVVNCVAIDFQDTKWIATENGLYSLVGDNLETQFPTNVKKMTSNIVFIDELNNKWVGTYNAEVYCLSPNKEWKSYNFKDVGDFVVSGLALDSEQSIWLALYEHAVVKQDKNGERTIYTIENSNLSSNRIFALFVDKHDGVWVGTEKGLFYLAKGEKKWKLESLKGQINAIAEYDGSLWVTMLTNESTEFWKYAKFDNWEKQTLAPEISKDRIKEIAFDKEGRCWLAASKIACFYNEKWDIYGKEQGFSSDAALDVVADMQGQIWVGTEGKGLFKVGTEKAQVITQIKEPLVAEPILTTTNKVISLAEITKITDNLINVNIKLNVAFEQSKAILTSNSLTELDKLIKILQENPSYKLQIAGHTDNIGNPVANLRLSEERSMAVKNYLVEKKIKAERITTVGFGGTKPIADNKNEKTRIFNRRVEIILSK